MKKNIVCFLLFITSISAFGQLNTDRILTIGRNALYFEDYLLSIQYFNQVIKIKPYLAEPYMYRAMAKVQLGDDQGAELDATEALERNPFLPEAYYIRGFARRRTSNYEGALKDFTSAYDFSPNSQNLLLNRMDAYVQLEKYDDALTDLSEYNKLVPKNKQLLYEKGAILLMKKDTVGAEEAFVANLANDSANPQAWSAYALLKLQRNKQDEAYKAYSKAIQFKSNYAGDYMNRGIVNVQRKNFREALSDYNKAIELDKNNTLAYYNRGLLRANLGDNNNALADLEKVISADSSQTEAIYRKALILNTLKMYRKAITDFTVIIDRHPYFLPAYWGIAEAYDGLKDAKESFRYRQMAYNLDKNKEEIQKKQKDQLLADNKIDNRTDKTSAKKKTELFNRFVTKNIDDSQSDSKYNDSKRGNIQNKYADVINERNFVLTYYMKPDEYRRTNLNVPLIEDYNKLRKLSSPLKITNMEMPLTSELVNMHFENINTLTGKIHYGDQNGDMYFSRSLEFAMVQDFNSAIDDLTRCLALQPGFALAYFARANIRYKLIEYNKNMAVEEQTAMLYESKTDKLKRISSEEKYKYDVEMIMRDLDKVIELHPEFPFSYFNKANILCTQKDYKTAIVFFTKAIEHDNDFAEAYFNRGLTRIFIGDDEKGIADLSKAGELGIYQSYNLIQRFKGK